VLSPACDPLAVRLRGRRVLGLHPRCVRRVLVRAAGERLSALPHRARTVLIDGALALLTVHDD
jgi:hypothetical protein